MHVISADTTVVDTIRYDTPSIQYRFRYDTDPIIVRSLLQWVVLDSRSSCTKGFVGKSGVCPTNEQYTANCNDLFHNGYSQHITWRNYGIKNIYEELPMRHRDSYDDHRNGFSWTLRWKHSVARGVLSVLLPNEDTPRQLINMTLAANIRQFLKRCSMAESLRARHNVVWPFQNGTTTRQFIRRCTMAVVTTGMP